MLAKIDRDLQTVKITTRARKKWHSREKPSPVKLKKSKIKTEIGNQNKIFAFFM